MKTEIYPGILAHHLEEYIKKVELVEGSGSVWAQVDIMDGQFVPNISVMPHEMMVISTRLKLEAHLMTFAPERYYSDLAVAGVNRVLLHREVYESLSECEDALKQASDFFAEVGLVINPETEIEDYSRLPIQSIQCMGVHPGASGQAFIDTVKENISKIYAQDLGVTIAVDGGVNEENISELQDLGVKRFVISSQLFANNNLTQNVQYFIGLVSGGI